LKKKHLETLGKTMEYFKEYSGVAVMIRNEHLPNTTPSFTA
jgi:hypothetical protein